MDNTGPAVARMPDLAKNRRLVDDLSSASRALPAILRVIGTADEMEAVSSALRAVLGDKRAAMVELLLAVGAKPRVKDGEASPFCVAEEAYAMLDSRKRARGHVARAHGTKQ